MKYFVLIPDGMADEKIPALGNRTPMEAILGAEAAPGSM